jgi:mercuric ion binding protein
MTKPLTSAALGFLLLIGLAVGLQNHVGSQAIAGPTVANEKTVTLAVQNMYCAACPHTVKQSLEGVPGVAKAVVSYKDKTAVVTYDGSKTTVAALINATTNAGYPSASK